MRSHALDYPKFRFPWAIRATGATAALIGAWWLVLWFTGGAPTWLAESTIVPKTNMALCQLLSGLVLLLLADSAPTGFRRAAAVTFASVALLVGLLTLAENLLQINLGIDQLLATEPPGAPATASPNRMGPLGALSLALLGAALLLAAGKHRRGVPYLGVAVCLIQLVPLVGYLYGAEELFTLARLTGISGFTVVALTALGFGSTLLVHESGPVALLFRPDPGGHLLRQILPPLIFIPLLLGFLRVWGERRGYFDVSLGTAILVIVFIVLFLLLLGRLASRFSASAAAEAQAVHALAASEARLRQLNAELESRVEDRTRELAAANRELESFSYTVSHDLKAPLRLIRGFSELLLNEAKPGITARDRDYLQTIVSSAAGMARLIDDILAFSRLGRKELQTSDVEMEPLVRTIVEEQCPETNRGLQVVVGTLPVVRGDRALLKQVMINLVSNAVKFTRKCDNPRIEIGANRTNGEIVFSVRDNGVGFDMAHAGKLFGVFQRLHSARDYEGNGIGLAFSKRIIERHGGRIWAEAKLNEGATFYFALPA